LAQLGTANADTHTEPAKAAAPATPSPTPGPVSASDAQRFLEAELFMEQTVMSTSGLRSYFFQLKLQKCSNLEDLRAMLPYYEQIIGKGGGEPQARVLAGEAKRLLGV